jgi:hypothetical protein
VPTMPVSTLAAVLLSAAWDSAFMATLIKG